MPPFSQLSLDARIRGYECSAESLVGTQRTTIPKRVADPRRLLLKLDRAASPNRYSDNHETYPPEGYLLLTTIDKSLYTGAHRYTTFRQQFRHMFVSQWIPKVPPHAEENHLAREMTPLERVGRDDRHEFTLPDQ